MRKSLSVVYSQPNLSSEVDMSHPHVQDIINNRLGCLETTRFNNSTCWRDIENIKSSLLGNPPNLTANITWLDNQTNVIEITTTDFYKTDNKSPVTPFNSDVLVRQPICKFEFVPMSNQQWNFNFSFDYRNVSNLQQEDLDNRLSGQYSGFSVIFNNQEIYNVDTISHFMYYTHQHNFNWNETDTLTIILTDSIVENEIKTHNQQLLYTIRTI